MRKAVLTTILGLLSFISAFAQQAPSTFYQEASWSPDGKMLSFTRMQQLADKSVISNVFVINADGTGLKQITGNENSEFYSAWMKDGEHIVFSTVSKEKKTSDICMVKKDGTGLIFLTNDAGQNTTPSVSRDGKKIAFVSTRDGHDGGKYQIYVMDANGANPKRLTHDSGVAFFNPVFSPNGKKIVYYVEKGDRKDQIWVMNADGTNPLILTGNLWHNFFPSWSADGKKIIFTSIREDDKRGLYTMNGDGSNVARWGTSNGFWSRFSPDGKHVAYVVGEFPNSGVYIASADGSNEQKLKTEQ